MSTAMSEGMSRSDGYERSPRTSSTVGFTGNHADAVRLKVRAVTWESRSGSATGHDGDRARRAEQRTQLTVVAQLSIHGASSRRSRSRACNMNPVAPHTTVPSMA